MAFFKLGDLITESQRDTLPRKGTCPTGKVRFTTREEARAALRGMGGHRTNMRAYRCGYCCDTTWATDVARSCDRRR